MSLCADGVSGQFPAGLNLVNHSIKGLAVDFVEQEGDGRGKREGRGYERHHDGNRCEDGAGLPDIWNGSGTAIEPGTLPPIWRASGQLDWDAAEAEPAGLASDDRQRDDSVVDREILTSAPSLVMAPANSWPRI